MNDQLKNFREKKLKMNSTEEEQKRCEFCHQEISQSSIELNLQSGQKDSQVENGKVICSCNLPSYKSAYDSIKLLESTVADYENSISRAESFIHDYFANLVHEIDLQRESMIKEIMELSAKLIQEVEEQKEQCIANLNKNVNIEKKIDEVKILKQNSAIYKDELNICQKETDRRFIGKKANRLIDTTREMNQYLKEELMQFETIQFESSLNINQLNFGRLKRIKHNNTDEGTIQLRIDNFSMLKENEFYPISNPLIIRNMDWYIEAIPDLRSNKKSGLAVFLTCEPCWESPEWSINVNATFQLCHATHPSKNYSKKKQNTYSSKNTSFNLIYFDSIDGIVANQRFYNAETDSILLQVWIRADEPKNYEPIDSKEFLYRDLMPYDDELNLYLNFQIIFDKEWYKGSWDLNYESILYHRHFEMI
jgi:hypothetical protein